MAKWSEIEADAPQLATLVRRFMDAGVHKTLATLRRDGSPRISGTEAKFGPRGLWFGSMPGAVKARDLQRDPRFALHSASEDPPAWKGDAKVSGRALEITDPDEIEAVTGDKPSGPFHLFLADISEASVVSLADSGDHLVIETWREGRGYTRRERR